jgi:flap endonuclease-1
MGIKNLMKVLSDNTPNSIIPIEQKELKGKKIAIDTSIIMYQYITAIRSTGSDLKGPDDKSTSHIQAILGKTLYYLKIGIIPIHIFDGKASELKLKILNDRSKIKKEAISKLLEMEIEKANRTELDSDNILTKEELDKEDKERIKLLQKSVSISHKEMLQASEIVKLLGVPCIFAPEEADSQCAYLSRNNLVDYIASEDMDLLTFGSKKLLRNFLKKNMCAITLDQILSDGNISMDQFIDLCILLGCDYTDTIDGIGQKKAWDLIIKYGSIEEIISKEKKIRENKYKLPDNFRYVESREYFNNPRHVQINSSELEIKPPQLDKLKQLLVTSYGYSENNIENMIGFLRKKYNMWDSEYEINKKNKFDEENLNVFSDDDDEDEKPNKLNKSNKLNKLNKSIKPNKQIEPNKSTKSIELIGVTAKSK